MQAATLPASYGWQWVKTGFRIFAKQPLPMFFWAMALSLFVLFASLTPPVGPLLFVALMPVFTLMTLAACKHVEAGRIMLPSMWPKPLMRPGVFRKLFLMGLLYAGLSLLAGLIAFLPFSSDLIAGMRAVQVEQDIMPFILAVRAPLFIFVVLYVIIAALFWHAPVLVSWHSLRLVQALFFSGVACWRNKWPFLVYGAAWILIFLLIDLAAGLLVAIGIPGSFANLVLIPVKVAAGAVLYCSFYPVYTTIFGIEDVQTGLDHRDSATA
ncbi:BPSS1780 family membrane protein [Bordetella avium]|uniref:Membrane protein n=1 Tax=Bordetella avium (strain 197N) TaxID=360910 RepID=Q2KYJ1_BORA1|nr:BPSS1780 family membrane protein [Bordetella avium]WQE34767.1 BPSS1780 family membrane protein [Bordetella avium]CAJ49892.1 putative membrane protein [Bordetella avium 197N]SUV68412.1 membrane protein [Bordetella avium]